jgi:predicted peroxiredoxin
MAKYLMIESRDPLESTAVGEFADLARDLQAAGTDVTLYLVQNGVFAARKGFQGGRLPSAGVAVLADDFSLRQRGIGPEEVVEGVRPSEIGALVDLLAEPGVRALWH